MRKFFVFSALLFTCIAAVYFSSCNNDKKEPEPIANKDSIEKVIARGEYLAHNVAACIHCHSQRDLTKFSGPVVAGTEGGGGLMFTPAFGLPGTFYSKNITPDPETGIGTWTDDEILRAITQGISKNGDTLFPLMPYVSYNHMAKEDLMSIIAYIRTLKPIKNKVLPRQMMMPIAMAYPGKILQPSLDANVRPPETDKVSYGAYLVSMGACTDCHTPMTPQGFDMSKMLGGGHVFDAVHYKVAAANITPDSATGIGTWNEQKFLDKFTLYRKEENYNYVAGRQNTIMPLSDYAGMKDDDLKAMYAFLRTIKPVSNKVEKYPK
jgi:mono/diheme cytochrome c family protein